MCNLCDGYFASGVVNAVDTCNEVNEVDTYKNEKGMGYL
jgi:hypothetical protein